MTFPNKKIRAEVIKEYLVGKSYKGVVCFSCGNATKALKETGLQVIDISPTGDFIPNKWFTPAEVKEVFPAYFDATSGHLPVEVMLYIAQAFKKYLGQLQDEEYIVPSGSGETLVCLKLAYPTIKFIAQYNMDAATEYSEHCVLNSLVELLAENVIK